MSTIYHIADNGASQLLAVGTDGLIMVSDNFGLTWESLAPAEFTGIDLYSAAFITFTIEDPLNPGEYYDVLLWIAVGENGTVGLSGDRRTWMLADMGGLANTFYSVATVADVCFIVGSEGIILDSRDGFDSFDVVPSDTTSDLYSVSFSDSLYTIVGADETVLVGYLVSENMSANVNEYVQNFDYSGSLGTFGHTVSESFDALDANNGRVPGQIITATVTGTVGAGEIGDSYTITLDGVDYTYVTTGAETTIEDVALALAALIAATTKFTAATDGAGVITISSTDPPTPFTYAKTVVNGGAINDSDIVFALVQESMVKQTKVTVGGTATNGNYVITLNGVPFTFARTVETNDQIATALAALVDASADYVSYAVGPDIFINAVDPTNNFTVVLSAPAPGTLTETLITESTLEGGSTYYSATDDGLLVHDVGLEVQALFNQLVTELFTSLQLLSSEGSTWYTSLREYVTIPLALSYETRILKTAAETLSVGDSLYTAIGVILRDAVWLSSTIESRGSTFNYTFTENLQIQHALLYALGAIVTETVTLTPSGTARYELASAIAERLYIGDAVPSKKVADLLVAVALTFQDVVDGGFGADITDTAVFSDIIVDIAKMHLQALETFQLNDVPTNGARISFELADAVQIDGTLGTSAVLRELLADGVVLSFSFGSDEFVFTGWVMNAKNFGVTEYRQFPFNSFARFNGEYLAAGPSGLYRLGGDTDDTSPIEAWLKTGAIDFGTSLGKAVRDAYIGFKSNGAIYLKVVTEDNAENVYMLDDGSEKIHTRRQKLERGRKAGFWEFEIHNLDGSDFELEQLEFVPIILKRRVN